MVRGSWIIAGIIFLGVHSVFAQRSAVNEAWSHLTYNELGKAKKSIDAALLHSSTKNQAKTWYYTGIIYQSIYDHKVFAGLDSDPLTKAIDAFTICILLDTKTEYLFDCNSRIKVLTLLRGANFFNQKKYQEALVDFEFILKTNPNDSMALLYAAYSADRSGQKSTAISYYQSLADQKFREPNPENSNIYYELSNLLKDYSQDTLQALSILTKGRIEYPNNMKLAVEQANLLVQMQNLLEAIQLLEEVVKENNTDSNLYLVLGVSYEKFAHSESCIKLGQEKEYLNKAEASFRQAIQLKPNYFDAQFHLGTLFFNQAADIMTKANTIKGDLEYSEKRNQATEFLNRALPYLEKAFELYPQHKSNLLTLKQIYIRKGDKEKYQQVMDALSILDK